MHAIAAFLDVEIWQSSCDITRSKKQIVCANFGIVFHLPQQSLWEKTKMIFWFVFGNSFPIRVFVGATRQRKISYTMYTSGYWYILYVCICWYYKCILCVGIPFSKPWLRLQLFLFSRGLACRVSCHLCPKFKSTLWNSRNKTLLALHLMATRRIAPRKDSSWKHAVTRGLSLTRGRLKAACSM